jgi:NADPH2:quinone reductase
MLAIEIRQCGGPEVLRAVERPRPIPGDNQVLIEQRAIGVNFVDLQHREGRPYPALPLPLVPGIEAAGVVVAVGAMVSTFAKGDRVAFGGPMPGAYAEYAAIDAGLVVPVPLGLGLDAAAAILMQGMTAHYLTHDAHPAKPGEWVLVHAAAGGVGRIIVAYAKSLGANVIGCSRSDGRLDEILRFGADAALNIDRADFGKKVREITGGCHAVYDSLGGSYFEANLGCLRTRGDMVVYGLAAGQIAPFDPARLSGFYDADFGGSLRITWTALGDHVAAPEALRARAKSVFDDVLGGVLPLRIAEKLPLRSAADAHRAMAGGVSGKYLLIP